MSLLIWEVTRLCVLGQYFIGSITSVRYIAAGFQHILSLTLCRGHGFSGGYGLTGTQDSKMSSTYM